VRVDSLQFCSCCCISPTLRGLVDTTIQDLRVEEDDIAVDVVVDDAVEELVLDGDAVDVEMLPERTDIKKLDLKMSVDVRIVVETLVLHLSKPSWHVFASQ
jgi:hypothetical protein